MIGKGWAKGLTAATDARVARAAEAHRGRRYQRRTPAQECGWQLRTSTTLPLEWSPAMAYIIGLTATDGCLISGRHQINFKSQDRELVETYLSLLGRGNRIQERITRTGGRVYHVQFGDARLYEWLQGVGLTPRKSLTLGAIDAPDEVLFPLVRGLLDGDGSVINKWYRADTGRRSDYYWEALWTKFYSASRPHLEWLAARIERATGLRGHLSMVLPTASRGNRHAFFHLRYGKRASHALLPLLYPDGAPCLARKRQIWLDYAVRHGLRTRDDSDKLNWHAQVV